MRRPCCPEELGDLPVAVADGRFIEHETVAERVAGAEPVDVGTGAQRETGRVRAVLEGGGDDLVLQQFGQCAVSRVEAGVPRPLGRERVNGLASADLKELRRLARSSAPCSKSSPTPEPRSGPKREERGGPRTAPLL